MKMAPAASPHSYDKSSVLSPPRGVLTFERFVERVRKFSKEDILNLGSQLFWYPYLRDTERSTSNLVLRAYGPLVAATAALHGSRAGRPPITEEDFRLLSFELLSVADALGDPKLQVDHEFPDVVRALESAESPAVKCIPRDQLPRILADVFRARIIELQWASAFWFSDELERAWLIYSSFRELVRDRVPGNKLEEFESRFFRTTPLLFIRAALAMLAFAQNEASTDIKRAGFIALDSIRFDHDVEVRLGIKHEDLKMAASILGTLFSRLQEGAAQLTGIKPPLRKYSEPLDLFARRPIIILDEYDDQSCNKLLIPSPYKYLQAVRRFLLFEFFEHLADNEMQVLNGKPAYSLRGEAFEEYLRQALVHTSLFDCAKLQGLVGLRPDFIWVGQEYGIMIEAKFTLRPNTDVKLMSASSTVVSWDRTCEAIQQADGFLRQLPNAKGLGFDAAKKRKWILLVCTYDSLAHEATAFMAPAKLWQFLGETTVSAVGLVSPAELEFHVRRSNPDAVAAKVSKVWDALNPTATNQVLQDDDLVEAIKAEPLRPGIRVAHEQLWGETV